MTNRRQFIELAGSSVFAAGGSSIEPASRYREHGKPLWEVPYGDITFDSYSLQEAQLASTHSVLMALDDDSLLRPYRLRVGAVAPGCDLGGWYSTPTFYARAETFGQWLSALSRYYAITGHEATLEKINRLLLAFSSIVEPSGRLFGDSRITSGPAYHYDKIVCALMDAHKFAAHPEALRILQRTTDAVIPHLPGRAVDFFEEAAGAHESYTLPENQFIVWQRGGDSRHLDLATKYLHRKFFDSLAHGENVLPDRHAFSHVNALCSAAKGYLVLGEESLLYAAINGFRFVQEQSFATGAWGPNDTFVPSKGILEVGMLPIPSLRDSLTRTHWCFETGCGSYAHFKLTRYLLRITKDSSYGDSMERIMYNAALGASSILPDGRAFYYSDYNFDGRKAYYDGLGGQLPFQWPCCSGSLPQLAADYRISTYFRDRDGIFVNLFIPSTVTWSQDGARVSVQQSGTYPIEDIVSIVVSTSAPSRFALRLRIPAWSDKASVTVNGRALHPPIHPGAFASIRREWRNGDRIELCLPRALDIQSIDRRRPEIGALLYGPIALFAITPDTPTFTRAQLLGAKRTDQTKLEWQVNTPDGDVRLRPFWMINNERYSLYLNIGEST